MQEKIEKIIQLIQQNNLDEATAHFNSLLVDIKQLDNIDQIVQIGYQFAQLGFVDFSMQIYEAGEKKFPSEAIWIVLKGELLMDDGKYEQALDELLQVEPDEDVYVDALLLQADAYQMLNWPEVSLVKLMEARELAPDEAIIQYGIAELRFAQGEFLETIPLFKALLTNKDLNDELLPIVMEHYSYALAATGEYEGAIDLLEQIDVRDRTLSQKNQLAFYYLETEEFEKANSIYEELYDEGKVSAAMLTAYAKVKDYFHDYEGAIALMDEAIAEDPFKPTLFLEKAELLIKTGNYQTALQVLEEALLLDPDYNLAKFMQLHLYLDLEDYDGAGAVVAEMREAGIEEPTFFWLAARLYHAQEEFEAASQNYHQAFTAMDFDEQFLMDYLTFLREEGNWQAIKAVFAKYPVIQDKPDFEVFFNDLPDDLN